MKTLITSLFVLSIFFVQAQNFDHIVYKQQVAPIYKKVMQNRVFKESIDQLNTVKKKYGMLYGEEYLLMSYCYKEMGNDSLAAIYAKESCSVLTFDMRTTWYIKDLDYGHISEGFNEQNMKLKDEGFEISMKRYEAKNPDSLLAVIDSMTHWDQFFRMQMSYNPDDKKYQSELDSMNRINEARLEEMVRKIGFPGEKKLQLMEFSIWDVLVHSATNEAFYQRMKPVFLNEVKKGNMSPWMYASWVDYHQAYRVLPTIYNSLYEGWNEERSEKELKQISKNRQEIGFIDLKFRLP